MTLLECMLRENRCYASAVPVRVRGVMLHSTGANNPNLKRYVQPSEDDPNYDLLMAQLGTNRNNNDWNQPTPGGQSVCVHGFIGKLADGSVASVQTLPWEIVGWHSGYASKTSTTNANKLGYIGFEICEDGLDDPDYFQQVYREAVELTAYLCTEYGLDPMGKNEYGYPCVTCHREGYDYGIAYGHADVLHWFPKFGKTMDDFRADVAAEMEDNEMDQAQFNKLMDAYLEEKAKAEPSSWSQTARSWAESIGLIKGDGEGNMMYGANVTREQLMQFLYRLENEI